MRKVFPIFRNNNHEAKAEEKASFCFDTTAAHRFDRITHQFPTNGACFRNCIDNTRVFQ